MFIQISPSDQLILAAASINLNDEKIKLLRQLLDAPLDWQYIISKASTLWLAPLLYHSLNQLRDNNPVPTPMLRQLREVYFRTATRNIEMLKELARILKAFKENDIEIILLKGTALIATVYHNPALRGFNDIDMLVRKKDLPRLKSELSKLGYKPFESVAEPREWFNPQQKVMLDLHWRLVRCQQLYQIRNETLWENAQTIEIEGVSTLSLSNTDMLHHLCLHLSSGHGFVQHGPIKLCDINELVERYGAEIDWEELLAKKQPSRKFICWSLYLTTELLGLKLPGDVGKKLEVSRQWKSLLKLVAEKLLNINENKIPLPAGLIRLIGITGFRKKLVMAQDVFFPPRTVSMKPASQRYYLIRPFELIFRHTQLIGRLLVYLVRSLISSVPRHPGKNNERF